MSGPLPPGFLKIEAREPAEQSEEPDEPWEAMQQPDERPRHYPRDDRRRIEYEATDFPERCAPGTPQELSAKLYGCSGSLGSRQYKEASRFRDIPGMDWAEARVALSRLLADVRPNYYRRRGVQTRDVVALAEFALTALGFDFLGKKGENAPKFRRELADALALLHRPLADRLTASAKHAQITTRPITETMKNGWQPNDTLQAKVPLPDGIFVRIIEATPEQGFASLEFIRHWLAEQERQRAFADDVAARLCRGCVTAEEYVRAAGSITAQEYAEAMHIAEGLEFMAAKLVALYAGIMHSIPLYRLYPATPEREAIELWWPWGRAMPLIDGGPARAPTPRKKVLDPGLITATRPQDVVRELMQRTGINRTTAQRMTANMRADMRREARVGGEADAEQRRDAGGGGASGWLIAVTYLGNVQGPGFPDQERPC